MSALNLCERCDALMLGKAVGTIRLEETPTADYKSYELCPACVGDFHDFMHSGPSRDARPFREPYKEPEAPAGGPVKELL